MRFKITTETLEPGSVIPVNYQYPLSAAVYRIIAKGNAEYASFLHETGYGRGFKFFTFSQINVPFKIEGDRLRLIKSEMSFEIAFHMPEAMEGFIKGVFRAEQMDIADKKSKASFRVKSVENLGSPISVFKENEIVSTQLKPLSPLVTGVPNDKGNQDYLSPEDPLFLENLIYNWRSKISDCYDEATAKEALLMVDVLTMRLPLKSRLITIKAFTLEETKIRGWMNFGLKVTAERRFIDLLMNAGAGQYNAQGCGCMGIYE